MTEVRPADWTEGRQLRATMRGSQTSLLTNFGINGGAMWSQMGRGGGLYEINEYARLLVKYGLE